MTDLHVKILGEGPTVVLVHGSGGSSILSWTFQHPLAARYRLLMPDRRGYGRSPAVSKIDYEENAKDIAELLGDEAHLVGASYGGVVSLFAAALRPDAILSLAVLEPPILGLARGNSKADAIMERLSNVYETMQNAAPEEFDAAFDAALGFPHEPTPLDPEPRRALESMMKERLPFDAQVPFNRLATARFPKLVISGGWSEVFDVVCDEIAERIGGERMVVQGAGHEISRTGKLLNDRLEALWKRGHSG